MKTNNLFLILLTLIGMSCQKKNNELIWQKNFGVIGSQSSPRACDLNEDGVLDIIMGAGKNEYEYSEKGILALDGKNGELLWQQEAHDQVFGSATFYDITDDGVNDVFIGGRSPNFRALNGKTGEVLWGYKYEYENDPVLKYARFNFYNSVLIPDQNNDGYQDLLIVNGGNAKVEPYSTKDRYPGVLMVLDAKNGQVLAADTMPDGAESYMSPIVFSQPETNELTIIFGSGGETLPGHLYMTTLTDLIDRKLSEATVLASEDGHGFIAPPVAVDLTGDGYYDIAAISHASTIIAIDGKTKETIWTQKIKDTESSNSFAVGYFTDDDTPDLFTFVSKGQWPNSTGSLEVMLDGKTGEIEFMDSLGCTGYSSPVVYDLNDDGTDEAIISINDFDCSLGFVGQTSNDMINRLIAIDFSKGTVNTLDQASRFKNIFSTPWIGDMDEDGYLDIVHCQYYNYSSDPMLFLGMRVKRISSSVKIGEPVVWGGYMGSGGNGVFDVESGR